VISFPNCKINLGLHICNKRSDGYHNIETIFFPVRWFDILEVVSKENAISSLSAANYQQQQFENIDFFLSGISLPGAIENNIVIKACELLKKDFPRLPPIQIHLHKNIPSGAGLGGGSADAAFALQLLNKKFNLHLSASQLLDYAFQSGSDCPFFIINKPCYATGRGEILEEIDLDLSSYKIVIVNPGIHVNTAEAFSLVTPSLPATSLKEIISKDINEWKDILVNDFEAVVCNRYPSIKKIKETLYKNGAVYASMSGSGSTVYGIFSKENKLDEEDFQKAFTGCIVKLL
jgi:4-diphosphocytidyl-2-C-methyl-D-erythritol kinase